MILNTFLKDNNSIKKNSILNCGKNPIATLHYGNNSFGRFIFRFDWERLLNYYIDNKLSVSNLDITHELRLTNTSFYAFNQQSQEYKHFIRAESFDLILYELNESFDEGLGYDQDYTRLTSGKNRFVQSPSNYFYKQSNVKWLEPGGLDTNEIKSIIINNDGDLVVDGTYNVNTIANKVLSIQHFPEGNENLVMDITEYVNTKIVELLALHSSGNVVELNSLISNSTLMLAFPPQLENNLDVFEHYVGFFSRHSFSAYSPYLQTNSNSVIRDDRENVLPNRINKIYYYNYVDGVLKNCASTPTLHLVYDPDELYEGENLCLLIDEDSIFNPYPGVYYFNFNVSENSGYDDVLYDVWGVTNYIDGFTTQSKKINSFVLDNEEVQVLHPYNKSVVLYVSGIDSNESINRGDVRKVNITPRLKFTNVVNDKNSKFFYRIYTKEGLTEIPFVEYSEMDSDAFGIRSFLIDTLSFLPNDYFIDFKVVSNNEEIFYKERIKYRIVSTSLSAPLSNQPTKGIKPKR